MYNIISIAFSGNNSGGKNKAQSSGLNIPSHHGKKSANRWLIAHPELLQCYHIHYELYILYFICRLDIDSNIGVKISIFGPDETTTDGTSKISDILPSTSLCEDDVANGSQSKTWKFITNYIFGHNERLRFIVLQKQNCSRWGPLGREDIIAEFFNWLLKF